MAVYHLAVNSANNQSFLGTLSINTQKEWTWTPSSAGTSLWNDPIGGWEMNFQANEIICRVGGLGGLRPDRIYIVHGDPNTTPFVPQQSGSGRFEVGGKFTTFSWTAS